MKKITEVRARPIGQPSATKSSPSQAGGATNSRAAKACSPKIQVKETGLKGFHVELEKQFVGDSLFEGLFCALDNIQNIITPYIKLGGFALSKLGFVSFLISAIIALDLLDGLMACYSKGLSVKCFYEACKSGITQALILSLLVTISCYIYCSAMNTLSPPVFYPAFHFALSVYSNYNNKKRSIREKGVSILKESLFGYLRGRFKKDCLIEYAPAIKYPSEKIAIDISDMGGAVISNVFKTLLDRNTSNMKTFSNCFNPLLINFRGLLEDLWTVCVGILKLAYFPIKQCIALNIAISEFIFRGIRPILPDLKRAIDAVT